jgi:hypothetical protein
MSLSSRRNSVGFDADGRHLTLRETERANAAALETERRLAVAAALSAAEPGVVTRATDAFCDSHPDFDAPAGSPRRAKGYRDGRILLRHVAQSVRDGSPEPLERRVLAWFVGHLDENNVTAGHIEVYLHFLLREAHAALPAAMHPFLDAVMLPAAAHCRNASASALLARRKGRIAEFAVDRMMKITADMASRYGSQSTMAKGRRDFEFLVEELAAALHEGDPAAARFRMVRWVTEQVMPFVDFPAEVWRWGFAALAEGVVKNCGPAAAMTAGPLLDELATRAPRMLSAVALRKAAPAIGDAAADELIRSGQVPALYAADEYRMAVSEADRHLLSEMAVLYAAGPTAADDPELTDRLAEVWCDGFLPRLPFADPAFQKANARALGIALRRLAEGPASEATSALLPRLADVARRAEAADRLIGVATEAADRAAAWCYGSLPGFQAADATGRRHGHRDLRLLMSRIVTLLPAGTADSHGDRFRAYVVDYLAPNLTRFPAGELTESLAALGREVAALAQPADAALVQGFLDAGAEAIAVHARLMGLAVPGSPAVEEALREAAQRSFRSNPADAGKAGDPAAVENAMRDGRYLLARVARAAAVGGARGVEALRTWYRDEVAFHARMSGAALAGHVAVLAERLSAEPEAAALLEELARVAPAFSAGMKLYPLADKTAEGATRGVLARMPAYTTAIGQAGQAAAGRDNAITLRGLAACLLHHPGRPEQFRDWWRNRIGGRIVNRPPGLFAANRDELCKALRPQLDPEEYRVVSDALAVAYEGLN